MVAIEVVHTTSSFISYLPDSCERHPVRQEMASISIPLVNSGCHVLLHALGEDRKIQPKQTNIEGRQRENILLPNKQPSVIQPSIFSLAMV